jgi:predicted ribosome quality control (RQC) complex YloA/Tae2 family protein
MAAANPRRRRAVCGKKTGTMTARGAADGFDCMDADAGTYRGRSVARRFVSPDGFVVLVGRTAADNDILTFKLGTPHDFWLHVSGESGSHVIVRNPQGVDRLPRETLRFAAALAAGYSKARHAGRVAVHAARCADVRKPRGVPPGTVTVRQYTTVHVVPARGGVDC